MLSTAGGSEKANFGVSGAQCATVGSPVFTGSLNYHDKSAPAYAAKGGLKLNGPITEVLGCDPQNPTPPAECQWCPAGDNRKYAGKFAYRSTNQKYAGSGTVFACVTDNGEGHNADPDRAVFRVLTGPYAGYQNAGPLGGGNIDEGTCTCNDGIDNDGDTLVDADDPGCHDAQGNYNPNLDEGSL